MTPGDITKLLRLRRQRVEKAMNVVLARRNMLARAEQDVAAANAAVKDHERQSVDYERQSMVKLIGRALRPGDLANLQSSLNARADRRQELLASEQDASARKDVCRANLDAAAADFRRRRGQAEKLSAFIARRQAKERRRALALAESASDEGPSQGSPASQVLLRTAPEDGHAG